MKIFLAIYTHWNSTFEECSEYIFRSTPTATREMKAQINFYGANKIQMKLYIRFYFVYGVHVDVGIHLHSMSEVQWNGVTKWELQFWSKSGPHRPLPFHFRRRTTHSHPLCVPSLIQIRCCVHSFLYKYALWPHTLNDNTMNSCCRIV